MMRTGDLVVWVRGRARPRHGTVEHVGRCGWGPCRYGDECVTVRFDGACTTENVPAGELHLWCGACGERVADLGGSPPICTPCALDAGYVASDGHGRIVPVSKDRQVM